MSEPTRVQLDLPVPPALAAVLADPALAGAQLVGGCVRDALLGAPILDLDVEVYGLDYDALVATLKPFGATDLIGRSFGVVKLTLDSGEPIDFSVPRRDSKVGAGHRGFAITPEPMLSPREAAARRDFTLNALAWDPRERMVTDWFGGVADLHARVLRHTSEAFVEDPLRVLRGMQLAARFELVAAEETLALCRSIAPAYAELPRERVWNEWRKWAVRASSPSAGMRFLLGSGWLAHFPELAATVGVEQDRGWHPEGDVWTHTLLALDALARSAEWLGADAETRLVWSFAVLLHDTGKAATTRHQLRHGVERVTSPGHEAESGVLAARFLDSIGAPHGVAERVVPLVTQHMAHLQAGHERAVRRLARRLSPETISSLAVVIRADADARPPLPGGPPGTLVQLLALAHALALADRAPRPILMGRHLLERGWTPGPTMGRALDAAFEAQLDGEFADLDGALAWVSRRTPH
jgi:tRNA nucleotidyltransferase (CCA-adding enzyme)